MIPMDQAEHITQFALVPSLFLLLRPAAADPAYDCRELPKGKAVSYCPDEINVQGKLDRPEKRDDGYVISLFEMSADASRSARSSGCRSAVSARL